MLRLGLGDIEMRVFDTIDSTSAWMHQQQPLQGQGLLCVANQQVGGMGRRGRGWETPPGNVALSLYSTVRSEPQVLGVLSLITAMAVCEVLQELCPDDYRIKWPNDVLAGDRKLCGLLVDRVGVAGSSDARLHGIITGIGINRLAHPDHAGLGIGATSLEARAASALPSRSRLIPALVARLLDYQAQFSATGWVGFSQRWLAWDALRGRRVRISGQREFAGVATGVLNDGALAVQRDGGELEAVYHGEVSVRLDQGRSGWSGSSEA